MWTGDNLDVMRGLNSETVDLIYLDPPFNSNRDYAAPIGSKAAGAAFKDTWTLSDVDEAWHGEIAESQPALYSIVDAAGLAHGKGMKAYVERDYRHTAVDGYDVWGRQLSERIGLEANQLAQRREAIRKRFGSLTLLCFQGGNLAHAIPAPGKPTLNETTGTQTKTAATEWT